MDTMKENILEKVTNTDERIGLVLGGGGAKGCYEIGALQAFKECGIKFNCVSGTSIGAIVGSVYACGKDDNLVEFVIDLKPTDIVEDLVIPESFNDVIHSSDSMLRVAEHYGKSKGVDVTPLKNKLNEMFDYDAFEKSDIDYACMTYNVSKRKAIPWYKNEGITRENANDVIIASASCFPAFPMQKIDEDLYIDGGYDDNLPVDLAITMDAQKIIAIDVKGVGLYKPKILSENIAYWEPLIPLGNFLDFRAKEGKRSMELGYLETMKRLDQYAGHVYTFDVEEYPKMLAFEEFMKDFAKEYQLNISEDVKSKYLGRSIPELQSKYTKSLVYEIVLEYLGYQAYMEPTHTYKFDDFLKELYDRLQIEKTETLRSHRIDEIVDERILEITKVLYKNSDRKIPLPLRKLDYVEDFMALVVVWKGLEAYLNK